MHFVAVLMSIRKQLSICVYLINCISFQYLRLVWDTRFELGGGSGVYVEWWYLVVCCIGQYKQNPWIERWGIIVQTPMNNSVLYFEDFNELCRGKRILNCFRVFGHKTRRNKISVVRGAGGFDSVMMMMVLFLVLVQYWIRWCANWRPYNS